MAGNGHFRLKAWSAAILILLAMCVGMVYPAMIKYQESAFRVNCLGRLDIISKMMLLYMNDNEGYLPDATNWCNSLLFYKNELDIRTEDSFKCRRDSYGPCSYAMNKSVSGRKYEELSKGTVVFFESKPGWNQSGGRELLNFANHPEHSSVSILLIISNRPKQFTLKALSWYLIIAG